MNRVQKYFDDDDETAFWDALDSAPARWHRKPEFMLVRALGLLRGGAELEARQILSEVERAHPKFLPAYFYQATLYLQDLHPAHVLRAINKIHAAGRLDSEGEAEVQAMEDAARALLKELAGELNVPVERAERASWYHEAAQQKLEAGQWAVAEQLAREALRIIPDWSSPRNNRSYVLYFLGRVSEALSEANAVLKDHPDNLHALKNLVIFHAGLGEEDKAREYSSRMAAYLDRLPRDADEADLVILVLGLMRDDERLWALAQKYLNLDVETLMESSWHTLGVAAVRAGRLKEAGKLLEKAGQDYEPAAQLAVEVRKALKMRKPASLRPELPGAILLLPLAVINEMAEILGKHMMDELPRHVQKKIDEYIQKRPFVINALFRLLTEPQAAEVIPGLLLALNRPEVDARLLAFGLGDVGTNQQRLQVLSALTQMGRELPPGPLRFWNEEIAEWRDVELVGHMISNDIELNISPKASVWAQKAQQAEDIDEKIAFWRKAVEADPKSGYAVHMLGILLIQEGQTEEGEKLARRAIEVDPDYMFAFANLALIEAQRENAQAARELLEKVARARLITSQTAFIMHMASMHLAVQEENFVAARQEFEVAKSIHPDDPLLDDWDERLRLAEVFASGWLSNWQQESFQRSHKKAMRTRLEMNSGTSVTLNSLNLDLLGTVARVWGLNGYGKKADLINRIIEQMHDPDVVRQVCDQLEQAEQQALQWTLENDGWRAWKEFTEKYGDDSEESPHWNYHEPESIVGRLRRAGFLAKGTLAGREVVFVPADLRESLMACLKT
ncbi:MAG TPA: hypothetical protein VI524_12355 [Anaerolineales bacterium]|nr:hypothetical protein [Anaerolineales bacterium]